MKLAPQPSRVPPRREPLAVIHDGPEHYMLQSEAGYIDARPLTASSAKSSCNARPDHTVGSNSALGPRNGYVRHTPGSDQTADTPERPFRAMCRHPHGWASHLIRCTIANRGWVAGHGAG